MLHYKNKSSLFATLLHKLIYMMKKLLFITSLFALFSLHSCQNKDPDPTEPIDNNNTEGNLVRIFVSDQDKPDYYFINPVNGNLEVNQSSFAAGNLYSSPSGRYVAVINTNDNLASFFDSGIEGHGDHAHVKGTPKWALAKSTALRPVHFYGSGDEILIFNDGEGTLSQFKEGSLHTSSIGQSIIAGIPHHGAPALFTNGNIAVTEKDGSAAGTLPERVKIIDKSGKLVHSSVIQTGGIHGEAGNGETVLFGSTNGILKVGSNGDQELIAYPSHFGSTWLGTLLHGKKSGTFLGFSAKFGLYKIDPIGNKISTIDENTSLFSVTFDWSGQDFIVLYADGNVKIFDGKDLSVKVSKKIEVVFPASGTVGNPTVVSTEKLVYISDGINGKIKMYKKENLEEVKEIIIPGKPAKMALMGSEVEEGGE